MSITEAEFRANPPRPGDKVWLKPLTYVETTRAGQAVVMGTHGKVWLDPEDIDRIERAPRVPVVGDRVKWDGYGWQVLAIDGEAAWLKPTHAGSGRCSGLLKDMEVIEP